MSANILDSAALRKNWKLFGKGISSSDKLYALAIRSITPDFDLTQEFGGLNKEFAFTMNPKSTTMDEPFATQITPTQDGQFVESQGNIYKNITISGTTGLRPNKLRTGSIIPILGIENPYSGPGIDPDTNLPLGERTGFEDLVDLKNLFRLYADLKRDPAVANKIVMTWQDGKQGEYYIVEPINFKTSRDSGSPMTTTYEIQLRTIEPLDLSKVFQNEDTRITNSAEAFFSRLKKTTNELQLALAFVNALIDKTATVAQSAFYTVLQPLNVLVEGLTNFMRSSQRFLAIPRNSLRTVSANINDLCRALNGYRAEIDAYKEKGQQSKTSQIVNALRQTNRIVCEIYCQDRLFGNSLSKVITEKTSAYINGLNTTGPTNLGSSTAGNSARQAVINGNDTIRTVAQRVLGSSNEWKVLVLLNNLKAPYISTSGDGVNVLRPGDLILYPVTSQNMTNITSGANVLSANLVEDTYGTDIKLQVSKAFGGQVLYDFAISQTGDIATVTGIENMKQAITSMIACEQGELQLHPQYGFQFPIGSKAKVNSLLNFHINARASLLRDKRIDKVLNFIARINESVLTTSFDIKLKNASGVLPIDLEVLR